MLILLVGAGGHAKAVAEAIECSGLVIAAYADPRPCDWLPAVVHHETDDAIVDTMVAGFVMGIGAVSSDGLERRMDIYRQYRLRAWAAPPVIHPSATASPKAKLDDGCLVLAGATIQPGAEIGAAAIINSCALVEHDSRIGSGAHIAPGAIVLGGATVGECAMIGAGAVVLPGAEVPDRTIVSALGRYPQ